MISAPFPLFRMLSPTVGFSRRRIDGAYVRLIVTHRYHLALLRKFQFRSASCVAWSYWSNHGDRIIIAADTSHVYIGSTCLLRSASISHLATAKDRVVAVERPMGHCGFGYGIPIRVKSYGRGPRVSRHHPTIHAVLYSRRCQTGGAAVVTMSHGDCYVIGRQSGVLVASLSRTDLICADGRSVGWYDTRSVVRTACQRIDRIGETDGWPSSRVDQPDWCRCQYVISSQCRRYACHLRLTRRINALDHLDHFD